MHQNNMLLTFALILEVADGGEEVRYVAGLEVTKSALWSHSEDRLVSFAKLKNSWSALA